MSDYQTTGRTRLVNVPSVLLRTDNWYDFAQATTDAIQSACNLDLMLKGDVEFKIPYQDLYEKRVEEKLKLELENRSLLHKYKTREEYFTNHYKSFKLSRSDVRTSLAKKDKKADVFQILNGTEFELWNKYELDIINNVEMVEEPEDPNRVTFADLFMAKHLINVTNFDIVKNSGDISKLTDESTLSTKQYVQACSEFEREKGLFLNQLFTAGPHAMIEPTYLEQLQGSGETWNKIMNLRGSRNLADLWAYLRSLQDKDFPEAELHYAIKLVRMDPTPNETLDAFNLRFESVWKRVLMDPEYQMGLGEPCVSQKLVTLRYRDVLRVYYASPVMNRILEPYYYPVQTVGYTPMPVLFHEFKEQIRRSLKAASDVSPVPLKLVASRGPVVTPAVEEVVAAAADSTNSNPYAPSSKPSVCYVCNGSHNTFSCRTADAAGIKELRDLGIRLRNEFKEKRGVNPPKATTREMPVKRFGKPPTHRPVVSYVAETESDSLYDQCLCVVIGAATTSDQRIVQLDNGANTHILSERAFFVSDPVPSDRSFIGVYADRPTQLGMVGESRAFGRAYLDVNARNILSQSRLEEEGFDITMMKDPANNRVTQSMMVKKGGHKVIFKLMDGIFCATRAEVMTLAEKLQPAVISVSTRGNPLGVPNNTMFSTSIPTTEPIIESEPDAMDVVEEQAPEAIFEHQSSIQPDNVHMNDIGLGLHHTEVISAPETEPVTIDDNNPQVQENSTPTDEIVRIEDQLQPPHSTGREPFYVPSLGRRLTNLEEARYAKAANLHIASGHAGKATEMQLLQGCHLVNTDLTPADIKIFHEISDACLGCVKGKMTMPRQTQWEIRTGALVGEYWELDLGFFGGKAYAILVEVVTNFVVIYPLVNRKATALIPIAQQWNHMLIKNFPRLFDTTVDGSAVTIKVKCDRELAFNAFASVVRPVHMARTSAEGHACRVEVLIRILKERARAIIYSLPYKLPSSRYNDLIVFIIDMKNYLPSTTKATSTPMESIYSKRLREEDMLRLQFGQMVATIVPPSQRGPKSDAVAQEGIIVGFEPHTPSNIKVYIPVTNHIVSRSKVIKIHSESLIRALNAMSHTDMVIDPFPLVAQTQDIDPIDPLIAASVEGGLPPQLPSLPANMDLSTLDNMTVNQAIKIFGETHVLRATLAELDNMERMLVFEYIDPASLDPKSAVAPSKMFLKLKFKDGKPDKLKARVVFRGDLQPADSYGETKSPTVDKSSLFMICALNKIIKGKIYSVDVPAAFLFAELKENLHMRLPKEITHLVTEARPELAKKLDKHGRLVVKLLKSLYGLKQSPLNWYHHLVVVLETGGFTGCVTDRCVFHRKDKHGTSHLLFHVDDVFISTNSEIHLQDIKAKFQTAFGTMEWAEKSFTFLGMYFSMCDDHSINVDMAAYTADIVERHWTPAIGEEFKKRRGIINPSSDDLFYEVDQDLDATPDQVSKYKSITMELLYSTTVRIDILKECVCAATQSHAPGPKSWKLIRQLIAYLKENPSFVINFGADSTVLTMYADAGYALHPDAKSHTGIFLTLGTNSGPILVKSKKQSLVTQSSTESELCALVDGVKKAIPLAKLLVELDMNKKVYIVAVQDNTSTITIARMGEGMHGKAKHFLVRFHFIREMLDKAILEIVHAGTLEMIADFLTKGMTGVKLQAQIVRSMYHGNVEDFVLAYTDAKSRVMKNKLVV